MNIPSFLRLKPEYTLKKVSNNISIKVTFFLWDPVAETCINSLLRKTLASVTYVYQTILKILKEGSLISMRFRMIWSVRKTVKTAKLIPNWNIIPLHQFFQLVSIFVIWNIEEIWETARLWHMETQGSNPHSFEIDLKCMKTYQKTHFWLQVYWLKNINWFAF